MWCTFLLVLPLILLGFMTHKAGGFGPLVNARSRFSSRSVYLHFFFLALTDMVGNWATLSLDIPDFTRFAARRSFRSSFRASACPSR